MESNQILPRRRRDHGRWSRSEQPINNRSSDFDGTQTLRRWRRTLAQVENDAARYRFREVEMLIGTAILAIEDAMKGATDKPSQPSS